MKPFTTNNGRIPHFQHRINFTHLITGYTRRLMPNIPEAITQIILLYHPKMNGYNFKWKLPNIRTLESSSDSDAFDVGLQNHFFLRAKYIGSEGEPTTTTTAHARIQILLMSFPLPPTIRALVLHCQFYCEELNQQHSRICTINSPVSAFQNNRNHNHNPIEIPSVCWTIVPNHPTPSLSIECTLNVLQIRAPHDNAVDLSSLYRPNRNNSNSKSKGIILYNYQVFGQKNEAMKFVWNITSKKTIRDFQKQCARQIVSDIYHDLFQFVAWKAEGSISGSSPISFSLQICGVPPGSSNIGVKLELSYYSASHSKVINILSKIRSFGYEELNNSLYLNPDQNKILTNELLKNNRLKVYCKACIIAKYGINNAIVSMQSSAKEDVKEEQDNQTKSKFLKCEPDSFVWHIDDPLILKQVTTKFASNCGLNSDPFELHEHEWYISIQAVKPNRYLSTPSVSTHSMSHKQIKISIDSLGFGSRESMDCKVSICLLQNGLKSTFYQKFPGRYFRDKDDTFLEVNVLSLLLLKKLSIQIDIAIVNHKNDDSLTLKDSKKAKMKQLDESVKSWLCDTVGMPEYCNVFKNNNINDMKVVKMITKDDMKYIGVNKVGDRIRMFHQIQLLTDEKSNNENIKRSNAKKRKQETHHNGYTQPPSKKPRL